MEKYSGALTHWILTMKSWKAKTNKGIKRDRKSRSNVIKVS